MSLFILVILLASLCCVQMQMFRSSYFKISSQENLDEEEDFPVATKVNVHDEFSCASMCSSTVACHYALFDKDSKKCSFVKATEILNPQDSEEPGSQQILLEKVDIAPSGKEDCASGGKDKLCTNHGNQETSVCEEDLDEVTKTEKNKTNGASCSSILLKNSSSPTGVYNITVGNITWPRWCEMKGVERCGNGVWELVMRIKGAREKGSYRYDARRWTDKRPSVKWVFNKGRQIKFPAYWLSSFTRICVTMDFSTNTSRNATSILLNYTAPSLHSAIHSGVKKTWAADLSTIKTPPNIDKSCLVQGFKMLGPHPWPIKSRIGVETQPKIRCPLPYLVRGVGIGFPQYPYISCGEIIISHSGMEEPKVEIYPAFCRLYIQ